MYFLNIIWVLIENIIKNKNYKIEKFFMDNQKVDFSKIVILLIALFYINILEINNLRKKNKSGVNNNINTDYIRYFMDEYDTSGRTEEEDKESIKNCQNSDSDYFSYYINGNSFIFDKYVDERDSVNYYLL